MISSRKLGATSLALCPHYKYIAAAVGGGGDEDPGGEGSRIEVMRLWRAGGEPYYGRELQSRYKGMRVPGAICSLSWSPEQLHQYRTGLLAGGLDNGSVCIWDTRGQIYPTFLDESNDECMAVQLPELKLFEDPNDNNFSKIEGNASKMFENMESVSKLFQKQNKDVQKNDENFELQNKIAFDGWELLPKENCLEEWEFIDDPEQTTKHCKEEDEDHPPLLQMKNLSGQVLGLSFCSINPNWLGAAGYGDKICIYDLGYPIGDHTGIYELIAKGSKQADGQITSLDWHKVYPVIFASSHDNGKTKLWDLRTGQAVCSIEQDDRHCTGVQWDPNRVISLAVSTLGTLKASPVKVWDIRKLTEPVRKFGGTEGVISLSWCPRSSQILTSHQDGTVNCWESDWGGSKGGIVAWPQDVHADQGVQWCNTKGVFAASSSKFGIGIYEMTSSA